MKSNSNHSTPLKVSRKDIREFNEKRIEEALGFFSRITNTCIYMVDYRTQKLIFANVPCPTLSGFPRDVVKQEGFDIYSKILPKDELLWLLKMQEASRRTYFRYATNEERLGLEFSYDLTMIAKDGRKLPLYQRIIPYRLCNNGTIWLALSVISETPFTPKMTKACIDNHITGERFDYVNGRFILSNQKQLTQDEITILRYLANGFKLKDIGKETGLKQRTVEYKKRSAFRKLGVRTPPGAVYRALEMGVI